MGAGLDACWAKEIEGRNGFPWPDRFIRNFPISKLGKREKEKRGGQEKEKREKK